MFPPSWLPALIHAARPIAHGALRFGLPNHCGVCGSTAEQLLCAPCASTHLQIRPRCHHCGHRLPDAHATHCGACLSAPPLFDRTHAALDYQAPWDAAIAALKFGHRLPYAPLLAQVWSRQCAADLGPVDCLLPAPLSAQRLRERGFNQSLEIAHHIARQHSLPLDTVSLVKVRDTPPQVGLSRKERLKNVRGAFSCVSPLHGKHVAVIDDVMTSGATLTEIANTLKKAGAARVTNIVIARTPEFD